MDIFDSSALLEALALDYLSFGFLAIINNFWTLFAVVTAGAVSFWRIRAAGCSPRPELLAQADSNTNGSHPVPEILMSESSKVDEQPREACVPAAAPVTRPSVSGDADVDGVTKGKFTVYYEDDWSQCGSEECTVAEMWEYCKAGSDGCKSVLDEAASWDKLLRLKMGKNGWYMHQDLTKINGNVVRFWDSGFGTFAKESRYSYSTSCLVW